MKASAAMFWPDVSKHAKEMWTYPSGWSLYFGADRLVDITVRGSRRSSRVPVVQDRVDLHRHLLPFTVTSPR